MDSIAPNSASKKRKYPFDGADKPETVANEAHKPKTKKAKRKDAKGTSQVDEYDGPMTVDALLSQKKPHGEEEAAKLEEEDKQEIEKLLAEIEERKRKKREKRALRHTAAPKKETDPIVKQTLEYLQAWTAKSDEWKWKIGREQWLIKNWLDLKKVDQEIFDLFVLYAKSIRGIQREKLRKAAKAFTKKFKHEQESYREKAKGESREAARYQRAMILRKALKEKFQEDSQKAPPQAVVEARNAKKE